jgi:hypothetical protein
MSLRMMMSKSSTTTMIATPRVQGSGLRAHLSRSTTTPALKIGAQSSPIEVIDNNDDAYTKGPAGIGAQSSSGAASGHNTQVTKEAGGEREEEDIVNLEVNDQTAR